MGRIIVRRGELVLARVVFPGVCIPASFKLWIFLSWVFGDCVGEAEWAGFVLGFWPFWTDILGFVTGMGRRVQRHADGTDRIDTGECSTIDFTRYVFSLSLRKRTEEQGHPGSIEMGVVIQEGLGCGICLLLIHLSHH